MFQYYYEVISFYFVFPSLIAYGIYFPFHGSRNNKTLIKVRRQTKNISLKTNDFDGIPRSPCVTVYMRAPSQLRQRKGVPKAGALIRPASSHHHDLWLEGERAGAQPWPGFGATAPPPPVEGIPHRASARLLGGSLEQVGPAMGAVTSGGFSFLRGCAVGRGVCEAVALRDAMFSSLVHGHRCRQELGTFGRASSPAHGWALVLVGNEAGSWFRPAVVEVVA